VGGTAVANKTVPVVWWLRDWWGERPLPGLTRNKICFRGTSIEPVTIV